MKKLLSLTFILIFCGTTSYGENFLAPQSKSNLAVVSDSKVDSISIPGVIIEVDKENDWVSFEDEQDERFGGSAILFDKTLIIGLMTRSLNSDGTITRSKKLRGKWMYKKFLEYFHGRFDTIQDIWIKPKLDNLSDNLKLFNDAIASGKSEAEAAWLTWGGQMALSYGFSKITFQVLKENEDVTKGKYQEVVVLFKIPLIDRISHSVANDVSIST